MADTLKKACLDIKFIRESTYEPCAINKQRQMSVVIFFSVTSEIILVHVYRKKKNIMFHLYLNDNLFSLKLIFQWNND